MFYWTTDKGADSLLKIKNETMDKFDFVSLQNKTLKWDTILYQDYFSFERIWYHIMEIKFYENLDSSMMSEGWCACSTDPWRNRTISSCEKRKTMASTTYARETRPRKYSNKSSPEQRLAQG